MDDPGDFLFEKMFFQAAHIAILEEVLTTVTANLKAIADVHHVDISAELTKINIAYGSIAKLKKGIT